MSYEAAIVRVSLAFLNVLIWKRLLYFLQQDEASLYTTTTLTRE